MQDNDQSIRRLQKKIEDEERQLQDKALNALLSTYEGRRLFWWMLEEAGIGGQPFTPDPHTTAFRCGELNVGNKILSRLFEVYPEAYVTMQKENEDAARAREQRIARKSGDVDGYDES